MTNAATTRALKAALRQHFPTVAFSVTEGGSHICWPDDGPTIAAVQTVVHTAGLEQLIAPPIWFDRYPADGSAYKAVRPIGELHKIPIEGEVRKQSARGTFRRGG